MSLRALMYHDVEAGPTSARYSFSLADFKAHAAAMRDAGLGAPSVAAEPSGFAITFDDGHEGWPAAAEALEALGWRAWFFMITDRIGAAKSVDKAALRRLDAAGHVIGSHSVDHAYQMSLKEPAFIVDQWTRSKAVLEDVLGHAVPSASVPGGWYSRKVGLAAEKAGVRTLFTSEPVSEGWADGACRVYGRFTAYNGDSPAAAAALASGRLTATLPQYLAWNLKKAAKRVLHGGGR